MGPDIVLPAIGPAPPHRALPGSGPAPPHRALPGSGSAPPHRALPGSVRGLAWAIADIDREPDWPDRLQHHLGHLYAALNDHVRVTEGAGGGYAKVIAAAPRLARGVNLLAREHQHLVGALLLLRKQFESEAHPAELRRCGAGLLLHLDRHRQRGIDLLYEAYGTDIGGET